MDADLVLLNGRVITMDHRLPISQGLAVAGGRILVGDSAGVRARMGPGTEIIDLGGRAVLPGLLETHCHPPLFGRSLRWIDCRPDCWFSASQTQFTLS